MPIRESVEWVLRMEGDLAARANDTAEKVAKMGLSAEAAKLKIKELNAEQKEAAEQSKVFNRNMLGVAAALTSITIGVTNAIHLFEKWVSTVIDANKHLKEMGLSTGEAGKSVDKYSTAIDGLTTSFDRLLLKVSGPGFDRLVQVANVLTKLSNNADAHGGTGVIDLSVPLAFATSGVSTRIGQGLDMYGGTPDGGALPPSQYGRGLGLLGPVARPPGLEYGPSYDQLVAGRSSQFLNAKPYVAPDYTSISTLSGVSGRTPTGFLSTAPTYGGIQTSTGQVSGAAWQTMGSLSASMQPATPPPAGSHAAGLMSAAGAISSLGGGLSSVLGSLGPAGMVAGAVTSIAPQLGNTFRGLVGDASKLPDQIVKGVTSILTQLPNVLSKTIPELVTSLVSAIPQLVGALVTALPGIITAAVYELPKAIGQAVADALLAGGQHSGIYLQGNARQQAAQLGQDSVLAGPMGFGGTPGGGLGYAAANNQRREVHVHIHNGDHRETIKAIKRELGSYGYSGANLDPYGPA